MREFEVTLFSLVASIFACTAPYAYAFALPQLETSAPYQYVASASNRTFDYVIIGGGLTGITLATRLAENPLVTIAILEAGDFYENVNGNRSRVPGYGAQVSAPGVDWAIPTTPQPALNGRTTIYRQGKCVGGSSATNLLAYHRSTKGAYDRWADAVGDAAFAFSNFLPWMRKSVRYTHANNAVRAKNASVPAPSKESYDATGGPLPVSFANWASPASSYAEAGWKSLGLSPLQDLTSGKLIGDQYSPMALKNDDQSRSTSASSYLQYGVSSGRSNLFIFTKSQAKRIVFDKNKKATSVLSQSNGNVFELTAKSEVILAAGVAHSPQLMLLSGIGPSATLKKFNIPVIKDAPGVGQNLQDHPIFQFAYQVSVVTGSTLLDPAVAAAADKEYSAKHTGILTHNLADHFAWGKLQLSAQAKIDLASLPADWPNYEVVIGDVPWAPGNFAQGVAMLQSITSRGSVSISSSSIDDAPLFDVKTLSTATDREIAIGTAKVVRQFFSTPSLKRITGAEVRPGPSVGNTDAELEAWLRNNTAPGSHGCCTLRMGKTTDKNAVVDTHGRVFGVKGLRVVDASVLPFIPPGHPVSTLYGIAEKFANDIKNKQ